jgi:hypothetical protein
MKKTISFIRMTGGLSAGLVLLFFLLSGTTPRKPGLSGRPALPVLPVLSPTSAKPEWKAMRTVTRAQLLKAFTAAGGIEKERGVAADKEMALNIYIVKEGPGSGGNNLGLLLQATAAGGKTVPLGASWNENLFRKETAWYIHFLRGSAVPREKVVLGYQLKISPAQVRKNWSLVICVYPMIPVKSYIQWRPIGTMTMSPRLNLDSAGCMHPPQNCLTGQTVENLSAVSSALLEKEYAQKNPAQ